MRIAILSLLLFALMFGRSQSESAWSRSSNKVFTAMRVAPEAIHIDGKLDDPAWRRATFRSDLVQRQPYDGISVSETTRFTVLYDEKYLYVGIYAYDSEVDKIRSILTRRDEDSPSDWVYVGFDSYNDNRTGFGFGLNPAGVKSDMRWFNDDGQDQNWDALWEGKTSVEGDGWSAEFKIPLRELRFSDANSHTFGLQIYRNISRLGEEDWWAYWPQNESGFVRHFGGLTGLDDIPRQRRLYVAPYANSTYNRSSELVNETHGDDYNFSKKMGVDIKYGLTNDLTMDVTINPDFGQVEADPAELNLSAFESYFSEKRPFFVEGSNIFHYSLGFGDGDLQNLSLFYSRRIGRSPQSYPSVDPDSGYHVDMPNSTNIRTAVKVSGRTQSGWSIGVLDAITARETATLRSDIASDFTETVEPPTNYFVSRIQRDFNDGRTAIGGILTATNRNLSNEPQLSWLRRDAYASGMDLTHNFWKDRYYIQLALAGTHVLGSTDAILNTQTSPSHFFQRPGEGADYLKLDSSATSLSGVAHKVVFGKSGGGDWRGAIGFIGYSPGFEANDLGFHQAVDNQMEFIWLGYRKNEATRYYNSIGINFNQSMSYTNSGEKLGFNLNTNGWYHFPNYWSMNMGINYSQWRYSVNLLRGGPRLYIDPAVNGWWGMQTDYRKDWIVGYNGHSGQNVDGSNWRGTSFYTTYRPFYNVVLNLSADLNHTIDNTAWYANPVDDQTGEKHYIVAKLNQRSLNTTLRVDVTLTPELTLQYYASPFITAGGYTQHLMVVDPEAREISRRYHKLQGNEIIWDATAEQYEVDVEQDGVMNFSLPQRDFNYKQYNSNLVLRWEYRPGSTLYLVWSQGRTDSMNQGEFALSDDLNTLFSSSPNDIFLIKASYLFNL